MEASDQKKGEENEDEVFHEANGGDIAAGDGKKESIFKNLADYEKEEEGSVGSGQEEEEERKKE
jgi:hypothetical protein